VPRRYFVSGIVVSNAIRDFSCPRMIDVNNPLFWIIAKHCDPVRLFHQPHSFNCKERVALPHFDEFYPMSARMIHFRDSVS
jgi:hypothetical protein